MDSGFGMGDIMLDVANFLDRPVHFFVEEMQNYAKYGISYNQING